MGKPKNKGLLKDEAVAPKLKNAAKHMIDSFDYAMTVCLKRAVTDYLPPLEIRAPEDAYTAGFRRVVLELYDIEIR